MNYIERLSDDKIENILKSNDVCMDNNKIKCEHSFAYKYAYDMTNKEGNQSAQAFYHNLNTLESRAGSQVPFSSINEGRDTSTEGRLVTKWLLNASLDGIGKFHRTSIFPISIFQYKKSVNGDKTSPNYDLKKLAIKSMCKRIYPNWVNNDLPWFPEEDGNPDTYHNTMGCIDGNEMVTYQYLGQTQVDYIKNMWAVVTFGKEIHSQGNSNYVNLNGVKIYDSKNGFVNVQKIICNTCNNKWMKITVSDGRMQKTIFVTDNHPFPTVNRGRVLAKDLKLNDTLNSVIKFANPVNLTKIPHFIDNCLTSNNKEIGTLKIINIECLLEKEMSNTVPSYDVTTDSDHFDFSGIYSHNCRTQLGYDIYGMGYSQIGRGNICPTTMILPKLGIEYGICLGKRDKADIEGFWNGFDKVLEITRKSLMERFYYIASQSPKSAPFMYNNGTIAGAEDCTDNVFNAVKHGTLAVGFIGVAEMCQALFGTNFVHDKEVYKFALSVVKHIYDKCKEWTKKYKLNFSVYATPAENLCHVAATTLRKQYGSIPFVTDKTYVTNSTHVPVWEKVSVYEKLNLEQPFTRYETGGSITYAELDSNLMNNPTAVEKIIDYAMSIGIPYLAINFAIDTCNKCGYQGVIKKCCPICGESEDIDRLARVTGYLSTDKRNFNDGKKDEVADRVNHNLTLNLENDDTIEYDTIRESIKEIIKYIKEGDNV